MTIKPKLNDLQLILLSHAANQASRRVLPGAVSLTGTGLHLMDSGPEGDPSRREDLHSASAAKRFAL